MTAEANEGTAQDPGRGSEGLRATASDEQLETDRAQLKPGSNWGASEQTPDEYERQALSRDP